MRTRTTAAAVCAVALVVLAACGGGDHHSDSASAPQPAEVSAATQTIDVSAGAGLVFDPTTVNVKAGETVAFKVTNADPMMTHEFVVGDADAQAHHEEEMRELAPGQHMADDESGISLAPGETKTIAFTFPEAGTILYGCHEPGHYPSGMKGEIKVT